jgi:hypothetical protein
MDEAKLLQKLIDLEALFAGATTNRRANGCVQCSRAHPGAPPRSGEKLAADRV